MLPTTLIYCPATRTRLFAIPCASLSLARTIALANEATLSLVTCGDLWAGYSGGNLVCHGWPETKRWLRRHRLILPADLKPGSPPSKSNSNTNASPANTPPGSPDNHTNQKISGDIRVIRGSPASQKL